MRTRAEFHRPARLSTLLLVLGLALILNSAFIAAFGNPTLLYVVNGLIHPALGIVVAALFAIYVARNRDVLRGVVASSSVLLLSTTAVLGIVLAVIGMTRPHSIVLYLHVPTAICGLLFLLIWLGARARRAR